MKKLLETANHFYWASIVISLGVAYSLIKGNFINVGFLLIVSALLVAVGFFMYQRNSDNE